jgi:ribokinase
MQRMGVCVLGSINLDIVARVATLPRPGETVTAQRVDHFPGGKGANQAVAAAHMGADTLMIGVVGADAPGERLRAFLESAGVDVSAIRMSPEEMTGQAYICVADSGENAIVIAAGANAALLPADIPVAALAERQVLLAQLESPVAAIEALFGAAPDACRILNAAPARPEAARLFALADILIVNELELAVFAGLAQAPAGDDAIAEGARRLLSRDGQTVIVTLGAAGCTAVSAAGVVRVAGRPAKVVDTTGAGDCFCGALAAALSAGRDLEGAMRVANLAASLSVECPGAASSMPTRAQVEAMMTD